MKGFLEFVLLGSRAHCQPQAGLTPELTFAHRYISSSSSFPFFLLLCCFSSSFPLVSLPFPFLFSCSSSSCLTPASCFPASPPALLGLLSSLPALSLDLLWVSLASLSFPPRHHYCETVESSPTLHVGTKGQGSGDHQKFPLPACLQILYSPEEPVC